jgi:S1-C subfamily serine protease
MPVSREKSILTLLPWLLLAAWPVFADESKDLSLADLIERAEPSCVRIDVKFKDGSAGIGSGFVVDAERKWVVTNYHVVADSESASVSFSDKKTAEVLGWRAHYTEHDLALLVIKTDKKLVALPVAVDIPRKGESTIAIGTPEGLSFTATEGIVSAIRDGKELESLFIGKRELAKEASRPVGTWLQTSTPISHGSSGGPLLNRQGEVIGVNSGTLASGQNINFAVSCKQIQRLVNVAPKIRMRTLAELTPSSKTWIGTAAAEKTTPGTPEKVVIKIPVKRKFRHSYKIENEEDEFDQVTTLRSEWLPISHDNRNLSSLGLRVNVVFNEEEVLPLVLWEVGVTAKTFQFLRPDEARFQILAGEDSYELPQGKAERKVERGGTSEVLHGITGLEVFVKMVLADTLKARLGTTEMEFDKRQIECLRDIASQIPEGKFYGDRLTIERMTSEEDPTDGK